MLRSSIRRDYGQVSDQETDAGFSTGGEGFFGRRWKQNLLVALTTFVFLPEAHAQWLTQSIALKAGWNGVFLHVDPSHLDLDGWVGDNPSIPINEIWRWESPSTAQFVDDPLVPSGANGWTSWERGGTNSALKKLVGDTAYLVESTSDFTWSIKGHPVAPRSIWNIKGLNLIGFSSVPINPPKFDTFLADAPELQSPDVEIYRYTGLSLTNNPVRISSALYRSTPVKRGQAFWMRSGTVFNKYFGPFEVDMGGASGIDFHESLSTYRFRLRNLSSKALIVTMELKTSESRPAQQDEIFGVPPLLVRGSFDLATQSHAYTELPLGSTTSWALAARGAEGSEVEVVLGLDRSVITENIGSLLAGILKFTDSLGISEVNIPVSGTADSEDGLWVGEALVTQVGEYLKTYAVGAVKPLVYTNGTTVVTNDLLIATNGEYVVSGIDTNITDVAKIFPLRLIVHRSADAAATLLQRVYYGMGSFGTNPVVSVAESALDQNLLGDARRISATHLPWSPENAGWLFDGALVPGASISATVTTAYDDAQSNPFLHTYHPDCILQNGLTRCDNGLPLF